MILINDKLIQPTTSSGGATGTFKIHGLLRQVYVEPTTSSTQYDFKLTNSASLDVYLTTSNTGVLSDETALPVRGTYSYTIANATADEEFNIYLGVQNK